MIVAQIFYNLSRGQAHFPRILSQNGQNDQGQCPPFSIPAENIPGCMIGTNFVIPAQTYDELSCGQGKVNGPTAGRTDRRKIRQYPLGLKGQWIYTFSIIPQQRWHGILE